MSVPERYLRDLQRRVSQMQEAEGQQPQKEAEQGTEASASSSETREPLAPSAIAEPSLSNAEHPQSISEPIAGIIDDSTTGAAAAPLTPISLRPASQGQPQLQPRTQRVQQAATDVLPQYNPLVSPSLSYVKEVGGRPRYLGPTSTWSFCRRALSLLEGHSPSPGGLSAPLNTDGTAFRLHWEPKVAVDSSDLRGLPPKDYALHLFNTCRFHFGELFGIVDEARFLVLFESFHRDGLRVAQKERLWFCSYLLLMAFGKAFLASSHHPFASRAMALLPDPAYMHDAGLPGIELLALVALYFQSIDMRSTSYQYIGQALRLAYLEGIHTHVPDDVVSPEFASRCNLLWWTVYVLDQEISANSGCPNAIPEGAATLALPSERWPTLSAKALTLRIYLSKLNASLCSSKRGTHLQTFNLADTSLAVYSNDASLQSSFIPNTASFLLQLAEVSRELDQVMSGYSNSSQGDLPQSLRHIAMSYHHVSLAEPTTSHVAEKAGHNTQNLRTLQQHYRLDINAEDFRCSGRVRFFRLHERPPKSEQCLTATVHRSSNTPFGHVALHSKLAAYISATTRGSGSCFVTNLHGIRHGHHTDVENSCRAGHARMFPSFPARIRLLGGYATLAHESDSS